jgi:hypothetical protein
MVIYLTTEGAKIGSKGTLSCGNGMKYKNCHGRYLAIVLTGKRLDRAIKLRRKRIS